MQKSNEEEQGIHVDGSTSFPVQTYQNLLTKLALWTFCMFL